MKTVVVEALKFRRKGGGAKKKRCACHISATLSLEMWMESTIFKKKSFGNSTLSCPLTASELIQMAQMRDAINSPRVAMRFVVPLAFCNFRGMNEKRTNYRERK